MNGSSFRDNPINWSLAVGTISGIRVRVHLLFILWIAFELLRAVSSGGIAGMTASVLISGLLFGTVLLHELGHCVGARSVGGDAEEILMWPLGGLAMVSAPMTPRAQLITTAAGPAVNLAFCLLTATLLLLIGSPGDIRWNPFSGFAFHHGWPWSGWGLAGWLRAVWMINYMLLLFNLLPTFPMDGGRLLQAGLWYRLGFREATLLATFVGMVGAVIYGVIGLAFDMILLVCIGVFGYLTCMRERLLIKHGMLNEEYGFGGFSVSDAQERPRRQSWLARRRARRAAARAQRERLRAQALEREIDDILLKVHEHGLHSLSPRERRILEEGTAKRRQGQP